MGSLTPVLSTVLTSAGLPSTLLGIGLDVAAQRTAYARLVNQQQQALDQLKARQGQDEQGAQQAAALQKAQIAADAQAADERRKGALRRAVARQKTLFSAQGLAAEGGSNEAVLLGLYDDAQADADAQARADALRVIALDQSVAQKKQRNLLEATQLAEQQTLARVINGF